MPASLLLKQDGTPITLIFTKNYQHWHSDQNENVQNWCKHQHYLGSGALSIPAANGAISGIIYGIDDFSDFYISGVLASTLVKGIYTLNLSQLSNAELAENNLSKTEISTRFAISWALQAYQFDRYSKEAEVGAQLSLEDDHCYAQAHAFTEAIYLSRTLINTPASDMMPQNLSLTMQTLAETFQGDFSEIVGDDLLDENYPMVHAVGRASENVPRLLELRWGHENAPKITLVGKGVCFDSGGLNTKTGGFMRNMKKDMGGAAVALGLAKLIMSQELNMRLRVLIPAVENAISANAFRPGDVIATRKGLTVEIDNTDAEGRLVLCDALTEADAESPDLIIDFATLTGACRVALGTELPGFFSNDQNTANSLMQSAQSSADPIWQLPLHAPYQSMLKSHIADTQNSTDTGLGGAITAALYLQLFVSKNTPWVHFDMMAWNTRALPGRPIGGEALGLRAVFDYLQQRYPTA